jgi:hypothetical protein
LVIKPDAPPRFKLFFFFKGYFFPRPDANLPGANVPRVFAHEGFYYVAGNVNFFAILVFPVDQEVRVRMGSVVMVSRLPIEFVSCGVFQFPHKFFRHIFQVDAAGLGAQKNTEIQARHVFPVFVNVSAVELRPAAFPVRAFANKIRFKLGAVRFNAAGVLHFDDAFLAGVCMAAGCPVPGWSAASFFGGSETPQQARKRLRRVLPVAAAPEAGVNPVFFVFKKKMPHG